MTRRCQHVTPLSCNSFECLVYHRTLRNSSGVVMLVHNGRRVLRLPVSVSSKDKSGGKIGSFGKGAGGESLIPSHIGDLDMLRVREAEKIIELDEATYGRMMLDEVMFGWS